uniref:CENP-V/GFA domain-containing protein n=1 Tax=Clytia hemisphaerica TaxID=252671 RepID=A0A7M5WM68_9CNID
MTTNETKAVLHKGSCHCGKIRFEVEAPEKITCVTCNCSICNKRQNHHFIVPRSKFRLLEGADFITTYTFNTHMAKHTFCKVCGVQSFYTPRSNPDGVGVMPHCIDGDTLKEVKVIDFDGSNWEQSILLERGQQVQQFSKQ